MAVNDIFRKVPVEVPNKSGFDMSNEVLATAKVGTLVPIHSDFLLPNDTVSLGVSAEIQLPPMATDFYGRVKAHFETFFVPCRLLYGGWQEMMTHPVTGDVYPPSTGNNQKARYLPSLEANFHEFTPGHLADYLGYGVSNTDAVPRSSLLRIYNPLKFVAYHKIWDDFYRDSRLTRSCFQRGNSSGLVKNVGSFPYYTSYTDSPELFTGNSAVLGDGVSVFSLRQRCFGKDYFTNCTPLPQAGQPAGLTFGVDTSTDTGTFSISALRAANSLQMWLERNNVAGYRYGDQIRAHFGIYPADAALDRPLYLGRQIVDVYNKSVFQNDGSTSQTNSNNPFSTVGAKYGSPLGVGSGSLCGKFTASEHGYLMTIFSLVPDSIYSEAIDRDFFYKELGDFPFPLLQGVGDQPITVAELLGSDVAAQAAALNQEVNATMLQMVSATFGYTQRYSDHKFKLDRVHGLLRDGENLQNFALQRSFGLAQGQTLAQYGVSTSFIEIPQDYLDNVAAVQGDVSKYGCWMDLHFNYHKISTLAAYSIPTLGEPKNTHTEVIENGGVRL